MKYLSSFQDLNVSVPGKENKKLVQGDRKLKIHTAIVETLIHTAEKVPNLYTFFPMLGPLKDP